MIGTQQTSAITKSKILISNGQTRAYIKKEPSQNIGRKKMSSGKQRRKTENILIDIF